MTARCFGRTGPATLALVVAGAMGMAGMARAQGTAGGTAGAVPPPVVTPPAASATPGRANATSTPAATGRTADAGTGHASAAAEQRIARLRRELHITSAQSQQWDAFAQVMRENAEHMDGLYAERAQGVQGMTAVDGLKSYEQIAQAHVEDLQKLEPAFETLYNALSDAQKRTADQLFRSRAEHAARPAAARTE